MGASWKRISGAGGAAVTALLGAAALVNFQNSALAAIFAIVGSLSCVWFVVEIGVVGWQTAGTLYQVYHNRRYSMIIVILVGAVVGGGLFGCVWWLQGRITPKPQKESKAEASHQLTDLVEEVKQLKTAIAQSPSVDPSVQIDVLKNDLDRLSKKKEDLTKQEKEILDNQAFTLQSLEAGRKKYLERLEVEKQEHEIAQRRERLEREEATKKAQRDADTRDQEFTNRHAPIIEYTITTFYRRLGEIAKQSSQTIVSDFPNNPPSIYGSNLLKERKMVDGEQIVRLGDNAEWEFHLGLNSTHPRKVYERCLNFHIRAGGTIFRVSTYPPIISSKSPSVLRVQLHAQRSDAPDRPLRTEYDVECSITDYEKVVEQGVVELIRNRYNEHPLPPKP